MPYHAANAAVWIRPVRGLELRGRWEQYAFSETETETPLVAVDDDGWRLGAGVTYSPTPAWTFDAGYREEYGPGASSHGFDGAVTFFPCPCDLARGLRIHPGPAARISLRGRSVDAFGVDAEWSPTNQWRIQVGAAHYAEDRDRPDAAAFDWDQTRLHARVTLILRSGTDAMPLPPALRARPPAGSR